MEPYAAYADFRRGALTAAMVGAAAITIPKSDHSLRGSLTAQAASYIANAAQEVVKQVDGEPILSDNSTTEDILKGVAVQTGLAVAAAIGQQLSKAACPTRRKKAEISSTPDANDGKGTAGQYDRIGIEVSPNNSEITLRDQFTMTCLMGTPTIP